MAIYTKTGDQGITSLSTGARVCKSDLRIDTYGTCDELNSWIGMLRASLCADDCLSEVDKQLCLIQNKLFSLGAELSLAPGVWIAAEDVLLLERWIDLYQSSLTVQRSFILPMGSEMVCRSHICRTVCRRLERKMVLLGCENASLIFVNRLSDYLFVLSRFLVHAKGGQEECWVK